MLLYKMIFEPQKYQKGIKEMVEFQFFTFVFFVPLVVELKMYSSMMIEFGHSRMLSKNPAFLDSILGN